MKYKRITILCGHYGSGKTNVAVNFAFDLKNKEQNVACCDLDIVNPYFRSKDSSQDFIDKGIRLIVSEFANTNLDIPSLPQDIYAITDDKSLNCIIDVGGDERGALALGRIAPKIVEEGNYEMLLVVNKFRPLTPDIVSTIEVMCEIENACGIRFTGIVNNSNLGEITTIKDVLESLTYAQELSRVTKLPIVATTVKRSLYEDLLGKIVDLFPLDLQKKII